MSLRQRADAICRRLGVPDFRFVEIESKWRVVPEQSRRIHEHLLGLRRVQHLKTVLFFDQFLDTPRNDVLRRGASLRLRYRRGGADVRLQYKGPGFRARGLLYRSEFSTDRLPGVVMEESHHDVVQFARTTVAEMLRLHAPEPMRWAMRRDLGERVLARITTAPLLSVYQKNKFSVDSGSSVLEPSLDRVWAFHIRDGLHALSTFCEFENEIKGPWRLPEAKLAEIPRLLEFDGALARRFGLHREPLDKYHRCASFFLPARGRR